MKLNDTEWSLISSALRRHAELSKASCISVIDECPGPASTRLAEILMAQCEQQIALAEKIEEEMGV